MILTENTIFDHKTTITKTEILQDSVVIGPAWSTCLSFGADCLVMEM